MRKNIWVGVLGALLLLAGQNSFAQMFYATDEPGELLDLVNFSTGQITDIYNIGGRPDSLMVNSSGQIIYSVTSLADIDLFNPSSGVNTVLANTGSGSAPMDMVFDPSGTSFLTSLHGPGKLARYSFTTGTLTIFPAKKIGTLDGLAYDPDGNLFAVVNHNTLCQIDPNLGTVLQTLTIEPHDGINGGDGLVYDPYTKNLWGAWVTHDSAAGNGVMEIPLTENGTHPILGTPIFYQAGTMRLPDGITTDGAGNLYIGYNSQYLAQYNIPGNTIVKTLKVKGIDSPALIPSPK